MKQWAAVKNDVVVHGGFDADQELIDALPQKFSDALDNDGYVPSWYVEGVIFVDVTGVSPRPMDGFYKNEVGIWVDGNPNLTSDRESIPADGTTPAVISYRSKAKTPPINIKFKVNGTDSNPVSLVNGAASIEVVSSSVGDIVTVSVDDLQVDVTVEA